MHPRISTKTPIDNDLQKLSNKVMKRLFDKESNVGICNSFTLIAFHHPTETKSIKYRQKLDEKQLHKAIDSAILEGANLFSIRGFSLPKNGLMLSKRSRDGQK